MYEEVLKAKKHFIILGDVVIGTDNLEEVASQDWFSQLMLEKGVDPKAREQQLHREVEEEALRMQLRDEEMQRQERERERIATNNARHAQDLARQQQARSEIEVASQAQMQSPPLPPQQQQAVTSGPQNMEFPFMDIVPDKMSPLVWDKLTPEQQAQWQAKYST